MNSSSADWWEASIFLHSLFLLSSSVSFFALINNVWFSGFLQRQVWILPCILRLGKSLAFFSCLFLAFHFSLNFVNFGGMIRNVFFQKLQDKDVVLKCLYDFDGEEEDELSITEGQVSDCEISVFSLKRFYSVTEVYPPCRYCYWWKMKVMVGWLDGGWMVKGYFLQLTLRNTLEDSHTTTLSLLCRGDLKLSTSPIEKSIFLAYLQGLYSWQGIYHEYFAVKYKTYIL